MSLRFWTICVLLVLLPLRGWAAASMGVATQGEQMAVAAHAAHAADAGDAETPPCHEAVAEADTSGACHDCTLCDICHGAVAGAAAFTTPRWDAPGDPPRAAPSRDTGRHAVGGLERPPRPDLA